MSHRYRLYPNKAQPSALIGHCGQARFIWNLALEQRNMWRPGRAPSPNFVEQSRQLTEARDYEPWLAAGSRKLQEAALRDFDQAWSRYLSGRAGRPNWRSKRRRQGFEVGDITRDKRVITLSSKWALLLIPKVGGVKFRVTRDVPHTSSARVTLDAAGRWHVSFVDLPQPISALGTGEVVGVDRGVTAAVTLSTGEMTSPTGIRPKEAERLLRMQRHLARAQRGSNRRAALKVRIARLKARETDRRKDWCEKITTDLARRFDLIRVEDLRVASMTRSARGTLDAPGSSVRAKAGLNRAILRQGWGDVVTRLEQKAPGRVERVDPRFTSQTCNPCKAVDPKSRKSQACFVCTSCGHQANADVNAARNIRDRDPTAVGRTVAARGDRVKSARSVKRELALVRCQKPDTEETPR